MVVGTIRFLGEPARNDYLTIGEELDRPSDAEWGPYKMPDDSLRLAVLIDADNASAAVIGDILSEVASLGTASVKRVYGDFTTSNLHSWRAVLLEHAIQPVQQFRNTVGKNASDSALIIDAMDLLHTRELGGFCLVSSDSDFTRLATRIREDGLPVYGFGEEKTPRSFINACDRFIYTEIFRTKAVGSSKAVAPTKSGPLRDFNSDEGFKAALDQSIDAAATESRSCTFRSSRQSSAKAVARFRPAQLWLSEAERSCGEGPVPETGSRKDCQWHSGRLCRTQVTSSSKTAKPKHLADTAIDLIEERERNEDRETEWKIGD